MVADGPTAETHEANSPHRHHRVRIAVIVVAGVLLVAACAVIVPYVLRDRPKPVTVDEALEELRATTSEAPADEPAFRRPAVGVYTAEGQGNEKISFPPNSQTDSAVIPASLTWLPDGCWRWRIDYNDSHWHEFDFCPVGADLVLTGQRNFQRWDFGSTTVDNLAQFTCTPPSPVVDADATPGTTFDHSCNGTNTAVPGETIASGPAVVIGTETITIGDTPVTAIHQRQTRNMTGGQQGVDEEQWWFAADTGLPLRVERNTSLDTNSPIGTISYTEEGSWQLTSMTPQR